MVASASAIASCAEDAGVVVDAPGPSPGRERRAGRRVGGRAATTDAARADRRPREQARRASDRARGTRCLTGPPRLLACAQAADELGRLLVAPEARHDVGACDERIRPARGGRASTRGRPRRRARRRPAARPATSSGIVMPGTSLCRNSAWRLLWSGRTPSSTGIGKPPRPKRRSASASIASTCARSYSGWVMIRWAPASILRPAGPIRWPRRPRSGRARRRW